MLKQGTAGAEAWGTDMESWDPDLFMLPCDMEERDTKKPGV